MATLSDDWKAEWAPLCAAIGQDFAPGEPQFVADPIEASALRRWLEPLEFDCPLHYDREAAKAAGYDDLLVPVSALLTFTLGPMWRPGETVFTSEDRNAQPSRSAVSGILTGLEPQTTGFLAADLDIEYFQPVVVGDRLCRHGARLIACTPKETKIGRGAFITWQTDILNQRLEVVATLRTTFYRYNPVASA